MISPAVSPTTAGLPRPWWESRAFVAVMVLLAAVPLIAPSVPPLMDLYGHMARYRVLADLGSSPELQRYFFVEWRPVGNLGVDLLVVPLSRLIGLEAAVKIVVGLIPVLTAAGMMFLSRAVHGRVGPMAILALPFTYSLFFHLGFVNFALGQALALLLLAAWISWLRNVALFPRAVLLGLAALVIWLSHAAAWGALVLLLIGWEAVARLGPRQQRLSDLGRMALVLAPALLPIVPTLVWRGAAGSGPVADQFFDLGWKWANLRAVLLEPGGLFDLLSLLTAQVMVVAALVLGKARVDRGLMLAGGLVALAILLLPYRLMGSNLADVRFIPLAIMLCLIAIDPRDHRKLLFLVAMGFFLARLSANTLLYWQHDRLIQDRLHLLDAVPRGGALLVLYGRRCDAERLPVDRLLHFGSLVTVRRLAFTNDQFPAGGGTPLYTRYPAAGAWTDIYRGQVVPVECLTVYDPRSHPVPLTTEQALARFPRAAFGHVLMVRPLAADPRAFAGLRLLNSTGDMRLYRVQGPSR